MAGSLGTDIVRGSPLLLFCPKLSPLLSLSSPQKQKREKFLPLVGTGQDLTTTYLLTWLWWHFAPFQTCMEAAVQKNCCDTAKPVLCFAQAWHAHTAYEEGASEEEHDVLPLPGCMYTLPGLLFLLHRVGTTGRRRIHPPFSLYKPEHLPYHRHTPSMLCLQACHLFPA